MTTEAEPASKRSIEAMKNAKATMQAVLDRNAALERGLRNSIDALASIKKYVAPGVYAYLINGNQQKLCIDVVDEHIAAATKVLNS